MSAGLKTTNEQWRGSVRVQIFLNIALGASFFVIMFLAPFFAKTVGAQAIYTIKTGAVSDSAGNNAQRKLARTSNGDLHAVYHASDGSYQEIFYSKSTDGGQNWVETKLTNDPYTQTRPSISVDSQDNLHVVWWGKDADSTGFDQIRYIKFSNGSWGGITDLTSGNYAQKTSVIAVDHNDNLHVIWNGVDAASPTYNQVRYIKFSNGSWGAITDLTSGDYEKNRPSLTIGNDNAVHVFWSGQSADSPAVYQIGYAKYLSDWSAPANITTGAYIEGYPSAAVDSSNNIHLTWQSGVGGATGQSLRIAYMKYAEATSLWSTPEILSLGISPSPSGQWNPFIALDSHDYINIGWNGNYPSSGLSSYQIRYIKFTDSWGAVQNLTSDTTVNQHAGLLWHAAPTINGIKINTPTDGFALMWCTGTTLKIYLSTDLAWGIAAPSSVVTTKVTDTHFTVSWTDNSSNETGFKVERKTDGGGWVQVGTAVTSPYDDTTTSANHTYQYRVRAYHAAGNSDYYTDATVIATSDTIAPGAPVITQPSTPTYDGSPVISGTGEAGATVAITSQVDGLLAPTAVVDQDGAWSIALSSVLSADTHILTAIQTDASMNASVASGAKTIVRAVRGTVRPGGVPIVTLPSINLLIPNNRATYISGRVVGIGWNKINGAFDFLRISYSPDGGTNWQILATVPGEKDSYNWIIPAAATSRGLIKIEGIDLSGSTVSEDESDETFAIVSLPGISDPPSPVANDPVTDMTITGTYVSGDAYANNPNFNTAMNLPLSSGSRGCVSDTLIKSSSMPAVYYCGANGKRYVFTGENTYFSWYKDFSGVNIISDEALAGILIGGNVIHRPGSRMVKIQSDDKVYAVARGGILRWIETEAAAARIYGNNWKEMIDDISDAFFINYKIGNSISS